MSEPSLASVRFIIDQIKELRIEIRDDAARRERLLQQHIEDTDRRFELMEEHVLSINKFKWMALGITSLVVIVVELIVTVGQTHV